MINYNLLLSWYIRSVKMFECTYWLPSDQSLFKSYIKIWSFYQSCVKTYFCSWDQWSWSNLVLSVTHLYPYALYWKAFPLLSPLSGRISLFYNNIFLYRFERLTMTSVKDNYVNLVEIIEGRPFNSDLPLKILWK